jgi:hypothetical protein
MKLREIEFAGITGLPMIIDKLEDTKIMIQFITGAPSTVFATEIYDSEGARNYKYEELMELLK